MNSWRDNVKDSIRTQLEFLVRKGALNSDYQDTASYDIADAIFDTLGITVDEQDKVGGYFMHHAGRSRHDRQGVDKAIHKVVNKLMEDTAFIGKGIYRVSPEEFFKQENE